MSHTYYVCKTDATNKADAESKDLSLRNYSTDGLLAICQSHDDGVLLVDPPTKPSYVIELMVDWPKIELVDALLLDKYQATLDGASDGWSFSSKGV